MEGDIGTFCKETNMSLLLGETQVCQVGLSHKIKFICSK